MTALSPEEFVASLDAEIERALARIGELSARPAEAGVWLVHKPCRPQRLVAVEVAPRLDDLPLPDLEDGCSLVFYLQIAVARPCRLMQEDDNRVTGLDQLLGLDIESLPRLLKDLPQVFEKGVGSANDPILIQTAPRAQPDHVRIEQV